MQKIAKIHLIPNIRTKINNNNRYNFRISNNNNKVNKLIINNTLFSKIFKKINLKTLYQI